MTTDKDTPIPEASADAPDLNYPDDLQIQAFNDFEAALLELCKNTAVRHASDIALG